MVRKKAACVMKTIEQTVLWREMFAMPDGCTHGFDSYACAIHGNMANVSNLCVCVIGIPIAHSYENGHVDVSRGTAHILHSWTMCDNVPITKILVD